MCWKRQSQNKEFAFLRLVICSTWNKTLASVSICGLKWCRVSCVVGIHMGSSMEMYGNLQSYHSYYQASQNVDQRLMERLFSRIKIILGHRRPQTSKSLVICTSYFIFFFWRKKMTRISESFIMKEPQKVLRMILKHDTYKDGKEW